MVSRVPFQPWQFCDHYISLSKEEESGPPGAFNPGADVSLEDAVSYYGNYSCQPPYQGLTLGFCMSRNIESLMKVLFINGLLNSPILGIQGLQYSTAPESPHSCFFVTCQGISTIAWTHSGSTNLCPSVNINSKYFTSC